MYIDEEDNYYILSFYSGKEYKVEDTILYNPKYKNQYPTRGLIRKYNVHGDFQWAWQLEGAYEQGDILSMTFLSNEIVVSGNFNDGALHLGQDTVYHNLNENIRNGFLVCLNRDNASLQRYFMTQGNYHRRFLNLHTDSENNIDLFMRYKGQDTIFGEVFEAPNAYNYGYLLKLSLASLSTIGPNDESSLILVTPNPSTDSGFHIMSPASLNYQSLPFIIFNNQGSKLITDSIWPGEKQFIETSDWPAGPYWIQLQNGSQSQTQLIIVQ